MAETGSANKENIRCLKAALMEDSGLQLTSAEREVTVRFQGRSGPKLEPIPTSDCDSKRTFGSSISRMGRSRAHGSAAIPADVANPTRRIAEASSEQAIEMRNVREANLQGDIGNQLRAGARLGQQFERKLQT